ncbi:O-Antigen ligase [Hyunsoonleella jejuensis]|uniref:O-Antigen ligase n=1 Tax=Hyunsoonleella jejuensis TaxID=419940 RepID=A0A1H9AZ24_9FLAO|nr:O-antigen ligase family protein [Hyunsoonleella jejuensis]SEP82030.1 O-Antigen ligase [Hyunsoonleella jejuensis]
MNFRFLIDFKGNKNKQTLHIILASFASLASVLIRSEFFSAFVLFLSFACLILVISSNKPLETNKAQLIWLTIPFFIVLLGIISTDRYYKGLEFLWRSSPLLLMPFIYFKLPLTKVLKAYNFIFKYFPILTAIVFLAYVVTGVIFTTKGFGNYLYYSNFSEISDIHTTYFGLILNISLWFVMKKKSSYSKVIYYSFFLCFFIFQLIVASKVSVLVCVVFILFDIAISLKNNLSKALVLVLLLSASAFFVKQFLGDRFLNQKLEEGKSLSIKQIYTNFLENDVNARVALWKSNIETLNGSKWVYGNGTNTSNELRRKVYKMNNLNKAFEETYNAHNQFVEALYSYGVIGLTLFILHCFMVFRLTLYTKDIKYNLIIYSSVLLYFLTESILQRTIGIVIYAFIITYIYIQHKFLGRETK